ncbi:cytochrome ubiquinol oxidase subunit I [Nocardia sp. alder85J]|uniref:cytochrome ubiquinol oxidase subunit I n=1 Tax=Nocardia sp. alder85J TaxID=2862949 RepID=UPI001CD4D63C|nr:cytochrome ubiquinol oxidase subunit I [Nocardia sp. alder85J]MCX4093364.1 cytochrome ubiquinol oxidase subunit I [Nocardia sp. alder85J]
MNVVDVARWQFGITTVYHFIFVPLTIGLAGLIAVMETVWVATGRDTWVRLTKFFGKLFLINFAIGVATGIVQEFQFGMAWSEYSRFVGDVFGAPLAMEALVAFFLESTFLGLWLFGWTRLPKAVHLACIWLVAIGTAASAYFIVAANSFMQHPVGAEYNPETGRAELHSIGKVLTNPTTLAAYPHIIAGAYIVAGAFVAAIAPWWLVREAHAGRAADANAMWRPAAWLGVWVVVASAIVLFFTGDMQGKLMFQQQPMKMASAESLCHTQVDPDFSVLTTGTHNNCDSITHLIEVPYVLPYLAESKFSGVKLEGVKDLQAAYNQKFGPGDYRPNLFVTYWSFRAMIGFLAGPALLVLAAFWTMWRGRMPRQRWLPWVGAFAVVTPFLANSAGWVFTEMGRQPWVVAPNPTGDPHIRMTVQQGVSGLSAGTVLTSLIVFTLLYGALAVVWFYLMRRYAWAGPEPAHAVSGAESAEDAESVAVEKLSFAY